jgi:predicted MFS family arabinose efflux permease
METLNLLVKSFAEGAFCFIVLMLGTWLSGFLAKKYGERPNLCIIAAAVSIILTLLHVNPQFGETARYVYMLFLTFSVSIALSLGQRIFASLRKNQI